VRGWLALQQHAALRPQEARAALEASGGDPRRALRALAGPGAAAARLRDPALAAAVATLVRAGAQLVPFGSPAYPEPVAALRDAAPLLAVRGDPAWLRVPLVAIVGARIATPYGLGVARRLARDLAAAGVGVVSGLAHGIDAAAHRGALEGGGPTLAVLGCGPERVYPAAHRALAREVAARGALVSELPPGAPPLKHHFPLRNRLISALAEAVVVVEARARSGTRITAEHALEQGREVLAVPGPVDAPTSEGPNLLLRDGAAPALDAGVVLRAIGREPPPRRVETPPLPPLLAPLFAALQHAPATRDELAARLGLSPEELARRLVALELEVPVAAGRDGRLRLVPR